MTRCKAIARRAGYQSPKTSRGSYAKTPYNPNPYKPDLTWAFSWKSKGGIKIKDGLVQGNGKIALATPPLKRFQDRWNERSRPRKSKDQDDPICCPTFELGKLCQSENSIKIQRLVDRAMSNRSSQINGPSGII